MKASIFDIATRLSRALISASSPSSSASAPTLRALKWSPTIEQTLHREVAPHQLSPELVSAVIDPFLLPHHSLALGFFNWATQQPNFLHDSLSYRSIIKSLSRSRHFASVDRILKQARSQNVLLDSSVYSLVIANFVRNKRTHIARLVFEEGRRLNLGIGDDAHNLVLAGLASEGQMANALRVFDEMLAKGVCYSTLGFGVFIWNLARVGELDKLLSVIDDVMNSPGLGTINGSIMAVLVVHGFCCSSRVSDASRALDELRSRGWKPDFVAYRVVAEAYRESGDVVARESVLKKKRKLGVAPRTDEYGELILSFISERLIYEAKELGEVLVNGNFPVDENVLNTLIGTISGVFSSSALVFVEFMLKIGKLPTILTLTNLSRNLCKKGKFEELLQVYQMLSSKGYFMDVDSYGVMVLFLCQSGRVKEAYEALKEMQKNDINTPVELYNYIMEACCRDELIRPAKRLWDEMFSSGCEGNTKTYGILIGKLSEIGEVEEAQRLFHHMLGKGLTPDSMIYRSLIEGFCREAKFDAAVEVLEHCHRLDTDLADHILNSSITNICGEGRFDTASKLLQHTHDGMSSLESHARFLQCLAEARELDIALQHIGWVKETTPPMLQHILSRLVAYPTSRSEAIQKLMAGI